MTMSLEENNLWGYDPSVLRRYAEFMHFTQGLNPDQASQYLKFTRVHRLYAILRCRYLFQPKDDQIEVRTIPDILPRLQLVQEWIVLDDRDQILNTIGSPTFNPRKVVVLEQTPTPAPVGAEVQGIARVTESSTDHLVIEASLSAPSILLITDNYSRGWRSWALPGSVQQTYTVLPANYTFMAIPPVGRNPSIAPGVSPGGLPDRKMDLDHHLGDVSGHGGMAGEISGCSGIGGRGIHRCFTALLATHPTNRWMPVDLPTGDQTFRLQDATLINHD